MADPRPTRPAGALARVGARRLAVVLGVWAVTAAAAVLIAMSLDDPVGAGARDASQPVVAGRVAVPEDPGTARPEGLPPLALVLDRPLPADLQDLAPERQAAVLRERLALTGEPRRAIELGAVLGALGRTTAATAAFQDALELEPGSVPARVGLALAGAATGADRALARAEEALATLERDNPRSQLVAFNRGWLAVYRRDPATAETAWRRAVALGAGTDLGVTARRLLNALSDPDRGARP